MLLSADAVKITWKLRRALAGLDPQQALEVVLGKLCSRVLEAGVGLDALEEALIQHAVRESGGNLSGAARLLRITRPQLNYRLKKQNNAP